MANNARSSRLKAQARERARVEIRKRLRRLTDEDLAELWRPPGHPGHPDAGSKLDEKALWKILAHVGISRELVSLAVGERDDLPGELRERWLEEIFLVLKPIGEERRAGIQAAVERIRQRQDEEDKESV